MRVFTLLLAMLFIFASSASADMKSKKKADTKKKIKLTNTYWRLSEMNGKKLNSADDSNTPYIFLQDKHNRLIGNTSCNNIGGEFEEGRYDYVGFEAIYTKMACNDMDTEQYMQNALSHANRYMINGDNLLLYNDNLVLAVFEAK